MATKTRPMTASELLDMSDDGYRYELIRGELKQMPPAGLDHGEYALTIGASLRQHVRRDELGKAYGAETGFILATGPDHVRAPDGAFVSRDRVDRVRVSTGYGLGAPDLAIEVVSPNDRYSEVEEKTADWLDAGTRAVIIADPRRRTVRVHRSTTDVVTLSEADTLEVEDVVPGWRLSVREIFG